MICWSCFKEFPSDRKVCPYCKTEAGGEPPAEAMEAVASLLQGMSPELLSQLHDAFEKSADAEEFVNQVMVGDCPECDSSKTADCENDPEIEDPCIGRCYECGQLWCLDCGEYFKDAKSTAHECPAWEGIDLDEGELGQNN